jgi:hypothetical protein
MLESYSGILEIRNMIKNGDKVRVENKNGLRKTGTVIYVDWYKEDGFLLDFAEGFNYRQRQDGGDVIAINDKAVERIDDLMYTVETLDDF